MGAVEDLLSEMGRHGVRLSVEGGRLECLVPPGGITDDLATRIRSRRDELYQWIRLRTSPGPESAVRSLPLTDAQRRLWFIHQLSPDASGYQISGAVRLRRAVDPAALRQALDQVVARHSALRTTFVEEDGVPAQVVRAVMEPGFDACDLSRAADPQAAAREHCERMAATPFDLVEGPLIRASLIRLASDDFILMIAMHHIVSDGWSIGILIRELGQRLGVNAVVDAPAPLQFADFAEWNARHWGPGARLDEAIAFWRSHLEGIDDAAVIPLDRERADWGEAPSGAHLFRIDTLVTARLRALARPVDATLFMVLIAVVQVWTARCSGNDDVCVGTAVANRPSDAFANVIGMFVNTLPLRCNVDETLSFTDLLARVRDTCLAAFEREGTPFALIVDAVKPRRRFGTNPLFQVMAVLQERVDMPGWARAEPFEFAPATADLDLSFEFTVSDEGLDVLLQYNRAVFHEDRVHAMGRQFVRLVQAIADQPSRRLNAIDSLGREREALLALGVGETMALPDFRGVHQRVAAVASTFPGHVALHHDALKTTYAELRQTIQRMASMLIRLGVGPRDVVGVCGETTPDFIAAMFAILDIGACFLPLDPAYPTDRLAFMMRDSSATHLVVDALAYERFGAVLLDVVTCSMEVLGGGVDDLAWRPVEVADDDTAYIIYTSGTSGQPKGVPISHGSLLNHNVFAADHYGLVATDVQLQTASVGFDLFIEEVFTVLATGACLLLLPRETVLHPRHLRDAINEFAVTVLNLPTALFHELTLGGFVGQSVHTVIVGGERLDRTCAANFLDAHPGATLFNTYGPTETTIISTTERVSRESLAAVSVVPIGRPIANTQIYLLDAHLRPVPKGVAGELYIAGKGVSHGYIGREDLTTERFVPHPFAPGDRIYRSGDRARWLHDGRIEYVGRVDDQVKVRGYRIEPGEIESALAMHVDVARAAVVVHGEGDSRRIVAFVVPVGVYPGDASLRAHLAARLPVFMVPASFVCMDMLPVTTGGKLDRRALGDWRIEPSGSSVSATLTTTEQQLALLWHEVTGAAVGTLDGGSGFFDIGGHSLTATRLVSRIEHVFGVTMPLKQLFEQPGLAPMASFIDASVPRDIASLRTGVRPEQVPLALAQERIWFLQMLEPESTHYNIPGAARISGRRLERESVQRALDLLVERHETLRTVISVQDGIAIQRVLSSACASVEAADVSARSHADALSEAYRLCMVEAMTPFDLAMGPLLRCWFIRLADDDHVLLLNMHHVISDGWSLGVLLAELGALLADPAAVLPALPIQYADYAVWQRRWLEDTGELARQLDYWRTTLLGMPGSLALPTDFPRLAERSSAGASVAFALDTTLVRALRAQAEAQGATLYMALLALVQALLYRYTGQDDICIGTPIANRRHAETEGLIGMFVNTLPLRTRVDAAAGFEALLAEARRTCLDAYEHQDTPFERIVEAVSPQRNRAISPLFQVMVILQNTAAVAMPEGVTPFVLEHDVAKFDLTIEFVEEADGVRGTITYATDLFQRARIERMAGHLARLGDVALAAPGQAIATLDYLPAAERDQVLSAFNATTRAYPREARIHDFVVAQMARTPERIAVVGEEGALTYAELDARSQTLARSLQARGIGPDGIVGLCAERSLAMVVAIVGIVRAGAAYLPLDPDYPADRLAYMLADSEAPVVLTQAHLRERIAPLLEGGDVHLRCLDSEWAAIEAEADGLPLADPARATNLCYVLYTSGSTGLPKGVLTEHRALVNQMHWRLHRYGLTADDVVLQKTPYSFDVSVWEFFWPLMVGAHLVLAAPGGHRDVAYLDTLIDRHGVTTLHFVPSMVSMFLEHARGAHPTVEHLFCGGEAMPSAVAGGYRIAFPRAHLYNLYGPTETAIDVTAYECEGTLPPVIPIGRPLDNTRAYILDRHNQPQPLGVAGELFIAGDQIARGYLNRPDLTAERFVDDPFVAGERMYRSGDLARWNDDGTIDYLGRIDTQVKLRGQRIELGEIEACLETHHSVEKAAVIVQGQGTAQRLVAFYRPAWGAEPADEALREHAVRTLPAYMVPSLFTTLATWPTTTSGKTDRRALAAIEVAVAPRAVRVMPTTDDERRMAEVWAGVLGLTADQVGLEDDFFELGGHSLLATRLVARMRQVFGVELPLRDVFTYPSLKDLTACACRATPSELLPLKAGRASGDVVLGYAQERLWFLQQLDPGSAAYNMPMAARISRRLDAASLADALRRLSVRHESLRTVFPLVEGEPRQRILTDVAISFAAIDLSASASCDALAEARRLCLAEASTPFDLSVGPLLRCRLVTLSDEDHVLMLTMHHIVGDGWSTGILLSELGALLDDPAAVLPALPIQYADYAVWQRRWLEEGGGLARQLDYWTAQLSGMPESLMLPTDHPRPAERGSDAASVAFALDTTLVRALRAQAEAQGATLYMALLALVQALLYRYTGQDDICIGTPIANRRHAETEGLIGMFVNTLPLRTRVDAAAGFEALLAEARRTCLDAYEHQDTPFERIVEAVSPQRNRAISPLFQVMVILQNTAAVAMPEGVTPFVLEHDVAKFDLTIEFVEEADGVRGTITYATDLFQRARIERMAGHLARLGDVALAAPGQAIATLDYLPAAERDQVLSAFNATTRAYPREARIHDFVVAQMARTPERIAVVGEEGALTYAELDARSQTLARSLQARGIGPDGIVGLCAERSLAMVVAIVGIVRAGAAYLPLDPDYPADRLAYMLADSEAPVVLTQAHLRERIAPLLEGGDVHLRCLDSEWAAIEAEADGLPLADPARATNLCYVLYTSGSTGLPKGVLNEHRGLVNRLLWMQRAYALTDGDVVLQKTPYSFDVSVWEFFWPLMVGASIAIAEPGGHRDVAYLRQAVDAFGVTTLHFVPSMLTAFLENGQSVHERVTRLICSGEALGRRAVTTYRERFPQAALYNLYGPTEAAIDVTAHDCASVPATHVPIGAPIDNLRIYILDPLKQPQPVGVAGELYIAGEGLARGYLKRPELTAERFVADPFVMDERMYRSGDLARWNDDGTIDYLGRIDTQVKLRGQRIELGEIEACLEAYEGVETAAVVVQGEGGAQRLIAAYHPAPGATVDEHALRTHAAGILPAYMLPSAFVAVAVWPVTTSGKTDRRALTGIDVAIPVRADRVPPATEDEQRMATLWGEVLDLPLTAIGRDDEFFDLGGHSLLAVRLMARIEQSWGRALPIATLFHAPTVRELVQRLHSAPAQGVLVPIKPSSSRRPVFVVPGVGGNVLSFRALAQGLGDGQSVYGLQAAGLDGSSAPAATVEQAAALNVAAIRSVQPRGPYRLFGHSFGGVVAFETARALIEQGENVESLSLLDAFPTVQAPGTALSEAEAFGALCEQIGSLLGKVVKVPVDELAAMPTSDWPALLQARGVEVGARQLDTLRAVHDANRLAYERYTPMPLPAAVCITLYRASDERRHDMPADHGWNALLPAPVRIVDVAAGHFTMLEEHAASAIAMDWRQHTHPFSSDQD